MLLFFIAIYRVETKRNMKNTLVEHMMRFETKNLSESAQKELIVKSIIKTINEQETIKTI